PLEQYEQHIAAIQDLAAGPQQIPVIPPEPSGLLTTFMTRLSSVQQNYDRQLNVLLAECAAELGEIRLEQSFTALGTAVSCQEAAVEAEAIALRAQGLNPEVLNELMARCESLRNDLRNYDGLDGMITSSQARSELLLAEMRAHRMTLTDNRKAFLSSL
ncbi:TPA: anti-phage protein Ppl, partial [Escherichia coli]